MTFKNRKTNEYGFTLAELLIVVAIIAVLVAVSVPIFTGKLEKSRELTDISNMRSAYSLATTAHLTDDEVDGHKFSDGTVYYYDADKGVLKSSSDGIVGYGKGTKADGGTSYKNYDSKADYTGGIVMVKLEGEKLVVYWNNVESGGEGGSTDPYEAIKTNLDSQFFKQARTVADWGFVGSLQGYNTNKVTETQYNSFVNELKQKVGVTGSDFYFDFSTASRRLRYTEENYGYNSETGGIISLPVGTTYTIVDFDANGNISKIYKNTVSTDNRVSFGKNGNICAYWDHPSKYEVVYEAE